MLSLTQRGFARKVVNNMTLGEKIQQLRKTKGLSQEQLAEVLNVSRQAISKWETDQSSPEIDKILALSKAFSVTTDELLGNAGDVDTSPKEKTGSKYSGLWRGLTSGIDFKDRKLLFMVFTFSCFLAAGVCLIVNYAIDQGITWAAYPLSSVLFGWLVCSPLLLKKYGLILSLSAVTLFVLPFLWFLEKLTPADGWFIPLGIPCAIIGAVTVWLIYLVLRFLRISWWYKTAISLFIIGVITDPVINYHVAAHENTTLHFSHFISPLSILCVSVLLGIWGYIKGKAKTVEK